MLRERYQFEITEDGSTFFFESFGPRGVIKKVVKYYKAGFWNGRIMYNLGFGDWNEELQDIDDTIVSNNGDRDKVLATVAATVLEFAGKNGNLVVFARGVNPARTRLYQMGINANLAEIEKFFLLLGFYDGKLLPFKAGVNYDGFWVVKK